MGIPLNPVTASGGDTLKSTSESGEEIAHGITEVQKPNASRAPWDGSIFEEAQAIGGADALVIDGSAAAVFADPDGGADNVPMRLYGGKLFNDTNERLYLLFYKNPLGNGALNDANLVGKLLVPAKGGPDLGDFPLQSDLGLIAAVSSSPTTYAAPATSNPATEILGTLLYKA